MSSAVTTPAATGNPGIGSGYVGIVRTYVAECCWPGVNPEILAEAVLRIASAAEQMTEGGTVVCHLQTTLVPDDEVVFCLFEATSLEAVEMVNRNAGFAFDHVAEAFLLTAGRDSDADGTP